MEGKRESDFLCDLRFQNKLPDPSAKIKLLPTNKNQLEVICKYKPNNSLEKLWKHEMHIEPDLGIPLDLLDTSVFNPPKGVKIPLDPEDKALLHSDYEEEEGTAGGSSVHGGGANPITPMEIDGLRSKERPNNKAFPWPVNTEYISPPKRDSRKRVHSFKRQAKQMQKFQHEKLLKSFETEKTIQTISSTSKARKSEPVHKTKPELKPDRVWTLIPDLDKSDQEFVIVEFEDSPTADIETYRHLSEEERAELESRAIMKQCMASSSRPDSDQQGKYVAYMVPSVGELGKDLDEENGIVSFTRIHEYQYESRIEENPTMFLLTLGDNEARYTPLPTTLTLKKKTEGQNSKRSTNCPVPKTVTMKNKGRKARHLKKKNEWQPR